MHPALSVLTPQCIATEAFTNATAAVARLDEIYERNTGFLRDRFEAYANGESIKTRVRATYPFVRITITTHARLDLRLSYGFVAGPAVYETTVTRPDLFRAYLTEQIKLLIENHGVPVEVGKLSEPIPVHFAYRRDINIEALLSGGEKLRIQRPVRDVFDTPDLAAMDDAIANGTQVGDHHHAEDAADELAPTFRMGFCGTLDCRRAGGPHGYAARLIREIERHSTGTHFCSRFPVSTSPV